MGVELIHEFLFFVQLLHFFLFSDASRQQINLNLQRVFFSGGGGTNFIMVFLGPIWTYYFFHG